VDWLVEPFGVEKKLNSDYGKVHNAYMKELTLKLELSKTCSLFQYICHPFKLSRIHGLV